MDTLISSAKEESDIEMLINWFKTGFVHDIQGNKLEAVEVSKKHKHELVKRIWSSGKQTLEVKEAILNDLKKIDNSDWMDNTQ